MTKHSKLAIVTGANRGIGLEVTRQLAAQGWRIAACCRDINKGAAALRTIEQEGFDIELRKLDVTRTADCQALAKWLQSGEQQVHALVNNAGVLLDSQSDGSADPLKLEATLAMETFNINTLGALRMLQSLAPLLAPGARVVNVSSGMGQLASMGDGYLAYRMSKTALNALTKVMSSRLAQFSDGKIRVNAACPGWVRTDMGGEQAERDVSQGADTIVWLASSDEVTFTGGFYRDRKRIDW